MTKSSFPNSFKAAGICFVKRWSAILLVCTVFTSCVTPTNIPVTSPAPMLRKKGELAGSAGLGYSDLISLGAFGSAAYSPDENLLVLGSFHYYRGSNGDSVSGYNLGYRYWELGAGTYQTIGENGILELFGGYGQSRLKWEYGFGVLDGGRGKEWGYNRSDRFFAQFNAGLRNQNSLGSQSGIVFGIRVSAVRFNEWDYQAWRTTQGGTLFSAPDERKIKSKPEDYIIQYEPSLTLQYKLGDNAKLFFQYAVQFSPLMPHDLLLDNSCSTIGLSFYFNGIQAKSASPTAKAF